MKKLSVLILSLLAITLFTSCSDNDEPVNKQTVSSTINSRAISGEDVIFSQGTAKVEINFTDMTIQFAYDYKGIDEMTHTLTTPVMKLTMKSGSIYSFKSSDAKGPQGNIDLATGMMSFSFTLDGDANVYSTTHLLYAYTNTKITNPDNGFTYDHNQSAYLFALDASGESCVMKISNFSPNTAGAVEAAEIQYNGLNVTPTTQGYIITAPEVSPVGYTGFYIITDLNVILDSQCNTIGGTFKCNDLEFNITGNMF